MGRPIGRDPTYLRFGSRRLSPALVLGLIVVALAKWTSAQAPTDRARAASSAIEFRSVKDNVPLGLRDTAAFVRLLHRAREIKPSGPAKDDRSDVFPQELPERPERFRGVPLEVRGIVRRLYSSQSPIATGNRLFEVWITTAGKGPNPIACIVEELPAGFPDRPVISEHAVVRGFFLKLMGYKVGDKEFVAPVLVGALEHRPKPDENVIEPPRDEVFLRLPEGSENRSVGPPAEEKFSLKLERNGRLTMDGEAIPKNGLARKLGRLAESIRYNIHAAGVLLPADRDLPVSLTLRAPDDTPCTTICKLMLDCQSYGFLKYFLELESGKDPPVAQPANAANSAPARKPNDLSEEQRTIAIRLHADQKGRLGQFQLGNRTLQGVEALNRELTAIVNDPNAPFDRADIALDPRLKYSEMVRVARLLANPVMTKVRFTPAEGAGRR